MVEFQAVTGGRQGLPGNEGLGPGQPGWAFLGSTRLGPLTPPHCELSGCLGAGPAGCEVIRERWSGEARGWLAGAAACVGVQPPRIGSLSLTPRSPGEEAEPRDRLPLGAPEKRSPGTISLPHPRGSGRHPLSTPGRAGGSTALQGPGNRAVWDPGPPGCKAVVGPVGVLESTRWLAENTRRPWARTIASPEQPRQASTSTRPGHPAAALLA